MNFTVGHNHRIPAFLGDYSGLFRTAIQHETWLDHANDNFLHVYNVGFKTGHFEGVNEGIITGAKDHLFNGKRQYYIGRTPGSVFPFSNVGELLTDKDTGPSVKRFMAKEELKQKNIDDAKKESKKEIEIIPKSTDDAKYHEDDPEDELGINDDYKNESRKLKETILMQTKEFKYNALANKPGKIKEYVEKNMQDLDDELAEIHEQIEHEDGNKSEIKALNRKLNSNNRKLIRLANVNSMIDEYLAMTKNNVEYTKKKNTKKRLENKANAPVTLSSEMQQLRQFKDGKIPIVITDEFTLVNEPYARKLHNKKIKNGLVDASVTSWANNSNLDPGMAKDYRTIPGNEQRNIDLVQFPYPGSSPMTLQGIVAIRNSYKK